jgi:hypothetical protein
VTNDKSASRTAVPRNWPCAVLLEFYKYTICNWQNDKPVLYLLAEFIFFSNWLIFIYPQTIVQPPGEVLVGNSAGRPPPTHLVHHHCFLARLWGTNIFLSRTMLMHHPRKRRMSWLHSRHKFHPKLYRFNNHVQQKLVSGWKHVQLQFPVYVFSTTARNEKDITMSSTFYNCGIISARRQGIVGLLVLEAQDLLKIRCSLQVDKQETLPSFHHQLQQRVEIGNASSWQQLPTPAMQHTMKYALTKDQSAFNVA